MSNITPQQLLDIIRLVQLKPNPIYACPSELERLGSYVEEARARYAQLRGPFSFGKAGLAATARAAARIVGMDQEAAEAAAITLYDSQQDEHHAAGAAPTGRGEQDDSTRMGH